MDGESAELFILGARVCMLGAWTIRASFGALTFRASGRIPAYWLSSGATTALVRCVARGSDRRPSAPAQPDYVFQAEGRIAEMESGHIVIVGLKRTATNDLS